jgi:hypothetical protein
MHFWNKLSTSALMRLTILASLNLLLGRLVDGWDILLHPWFFLGVVTLNLGLYALMVYPRTLNTTLIGMMLGGLAATVGIIAYVGMDPRSFMYGGPFRDLGFQIGSFVNRLLQALPDQVYSGGPLQLGGAGQFRLGYLAVDVPGLLVIAAGGWLARRLQERIRSDSSLSQG